MKSIVQSSMVPYPIPTMPYALQDDLRHIETPRCQAQRVSRGHRPLSAACALLAFASFAMPVRGNEAAEQGPDAAAAFVDRVAQTFRTLDSYEDRYRFEFVLTGSDIHGAPFTQREATEGSLAFVAPNRMALDHGDAFLIRSNGTDAWTAVPQVLQFRKQPAKRHVDIESMMPAVMAGSTLRHPAALILGQPELDVEDHFPFIRQWLEVDAQELDGRPGHRVVGEIFNPHYEIFSEPRRLEVWVDASDGLPRQVTIDLTDHMRTLAGTNMYDLPAKVDHAGIILKFKNVRTNHAIEATRFVYEPSTYDAQVERFTSEVDHERSMMNRPAPDFSGRDITGKKLALEDLRGRVVLLDFWSIGCGPCIVAMPSLQHLADQFADKPVSVIGINNDPLEYRDMVESLLERKQVRFQQFMDPDNKVYLAYFIRAVPCTFVIDQKGIIRHIHTGLTRDFQQRMASMIESLLVDDGEAG